MKKVRPLIAANFKMNARPFSLEWSTGSRPSTPYHTRDEVDVVVFPSFLDIEDCIRFGLVVGAQCGRAQEQGAYTGDISMAMLARKEVLYVLCGHSERRVQHGETDAMVSEQVTSALSHGLVPIVCIGETLEERNAGKTEAVLVRQLSHIDPASEIVIAYEPVWAIGSQKTPSNDEITDAISCIRSQVPSDDVRIVYGGSVSGANASAILSIDGIGGALVGGASLKPDEFLQIVEAAIR